MEQNRISPDDPRLTAYALNEMEPAARAEFEQALALDAAARQAVMEISATVSALTRALEQEPMEPMAEPPAQPVAPAKVIRFPYWMISSLAAACFAVFFIYWQRHELMPPAQQDSEMPVAAAPVAATPVEPQPIATAVVKRREPVNREEIQAKATAAPPPKPAVMTMRAADSGAIQAGNKPSVPAAMGGAAGPDETVVLNPFQVAAADDASSVAGSPNPPAGSGVRSQGRDSGSAIRGDGQMARGDRWQVATGPSVEAYSFRKDNRYRRVQDHPLSTFSVDVDTASYANVRRFLNQGQRPPADAVRIEELVNYFPYDYQPPADRTPFSTDLEVASAPWAPAHRLVRIGLKGREISDAGRPAANLVFLLDVSGSMNEPNKLPLVQQSLRLLLEKLRPDDRVAIAVYAGASGLVLPSTSAAHKAEIMDAIDRLQAEGSTNGALGIQLAYDLARANFIPGGVNRVILATDGDFNVGPTREGELVRLVQEKAKSGVFLTVLGFGTGNLKDGTLEQLADKGNGHYACIDSLAEAKKTLVEQAGGTLVTIAKDVKIQVEFNPAVVQAYRLIGYENRLLAKEDFNHDRVDAGEVGAGHTVTALYEVVPAGAAMPGDTPAVEALKYQQPGNRGPGTEAGARNNEMLTVKIRYKEPADDQSKLLEFPLHDRGKVFAQASQDFKFAAAVAAFGLVLRDSPDKGTATLEGVAGWARDGLGNDAGGYRGEFLGLVGRAQQIRP